MFVPTQTGWAVSRLRLHFWIYALCYLKTTRGLLSPHHHTFINLQCRSTLRGLHFVRSGDYVNMSRIAPMMLTAESRVIKIAGTHRIAVGIMLGSVTKCAIISEALVGSSNSPYAVHKVSIAPFAQEMRRDTSVWGAVLGFRVITGSVSNLGVLFSTRRQVNIPQGGNTTPKKGASYLVHVKSPLASGAGRGRSSYPTSRAFEDTSMFVPFCPHSLDLLRELSSPHL